MTESMKEKVLSMIEGIYPDVNYNIPTNLAKAVVENLSAFKIDYEDDKGRKGVTLLTEPLGRSLGLVINDEVDEREDPVKCLKAEFFLINNMRLFIKENIGVDDVELAISLLHTPACYYMKEIARGKLPEGIKDNDTMKSILLAAEQYK